MNSKSADHWLSPKNLLQLRKTPLSTSHQQKSLEKPLGILGAGQLAWMLAEAAHDLDLGQEVRIFAKHSKESAVLAGFPTVLGDSQSPEDLDSWMKGGQTVLIESELTPFGPLEKALSTSGARLLPALSALAVARDKFRQKKLFDELGLSQPKWRELRLEMDQHNQNSEATQTRLQNLAEKELPQAYPRGFVLKWGLDGYDGKGVLLVDSDRLGEIQKKAPRPAGPLKDSLTLVLDFLNAALSRRIPVYVEELIDYSAECALTTTVSLSGDKLYYPLMMSEQRQGTCFRVTSTFGESPATKNVLEEKAREAAKTVADYLKLEGSFTLEFFVTKDQRLLLNEMAPRVHNSCHVSQMTDKASQFHNHIRAALGLPLLKPEFPPFYGMTNILGPEVSGSTTQIPVSAPDLGGLWERGVAPQASSGSFFYWYDKETTGTRRKLGHINSWATSAAALQKEFAKIDLWLSKWEETIRGMKRT